MTKERKKSLLKEEDRQLVVGRPDYFQCDNSVVTSKYTLLTFLPIVSTVQYL